MYILKFKNVETIEQWLRANIHYVDSFIDEIKHKTNLNIDREKIFKLRYQQMIKGMYLNQNGINQY